MGGRGPAAALEGPDRGDPARPGRGRWSTPCSRRPRGSAGSAKRRRRGPAGCRPRGTPPPITPARKAASGPIIMGGMAQLRTQGRNPSLVGTDSTEPLHTLLAGPMVRSRAARSPGRGHHARLGRATGHQARRRGRRDGRPAGQRAVEGQDRRHRGAAEAAAGAEVHGRPAADARRGVAGRPGEPRRLRADGARGEARRHRPRGSATPGSCSRPAARPTTSWPAGPTGSPGRPRRWRCGRPTRWTARSTTAPRSRPSAPRPIPRWGSRCWPPCSSSSRR